MKFLTRLLHNYEHYRDKLLPHDILNSADIDRPFKYRLVADMAIICMIFVICFASYYPLITHFVWPGVLFNFSFSIILLSFHTYLLTRLRLEPTHEKTAHWLIFSIFIAICIGTVLTGGPLKSITPIFLPLPIMMAFLVINKSTGLIYSALSFSFFIISAIFSLYGADFPQTIPSTNTNAVYLLLWSFFSITMLALVLAYDSLNNKLIYQLKYEQEKQLYLATHDSLTKLANRQKFDIQLNEALHRSHRIGNRVLLINIDLNKFKPINDNFGHDAGDIILQHVAKQLTSTLRTDDLAARIGGDEFAIILQGSYNISDIDALMTRLSSKLKTPVDYKNMELSVSASIGIASYPDQTKTEDDLRKAADVAMYAAKKKHKDWVFFNESLVD